MFARLFGGGKKRDAELHAAAQSSDMAGVRQALDKGADINALDLVHRETVLHVAEPSHKVGAGGTANRELGERMSARGSPRNKKIVRAASFGLLLSLFSIAAYAQSGTHPGDNPLIVGGAFGLLFAGAGWAFAAELSSNPYGNYRVVKWLAGISLGVVLLLCLAIAFGKNSEEGLVRFALIGYVFFALPLLMLIFSARKGARQFMERQQEEMQKAEEQKFAAAERIRLESAQDEARRDAQREKKRQAAEAKKKKQPEEFTGGAEEAPKKIARKASQKIELGIWCPSIRYSEEEHGRNLPNDFKKAQTAWMKSENDPASPHYAEAARLLAKWFESDFVVGYGISMDMAVTADNEMGEVKEVKSHDVSAPVSYAFKKIPKLKTLSVAAIDFRSSTSSGSIKEDEKMLRSPDLGFVVLFQAEITKSFDSPEAFATWLKGDGEAIASCFRLGIKDKAIETTVTDDDGDTYTSTNTSWSGGDLHLEVNTGLDSEGFRNTLVSKVLVERETPQLLGEGTSPLKAIFMQADESAIRAQLDGGLDPNSRIDDQPLIKYALMTCATATQWYGHEELQESIHESYSRIEDYVAALKRIAILLLDRGADVNAPSDHISTIGVAALLDDPALLDKCLATVKSVNDINSTPFLLAAERGDVASLKVFLDRDARINKREFLHGTTPLMLAAQGEGGEDGPPLEGEDARRHEEAVAFLLDRGAEIDAVSDTGDTAISNAVRRGNIGIVKLLLDRGARTREALPRGQRLIDLAQERGHHEIVDLLSKQPA